MYAILISMYGTVCTHVMYHMYTTMAYSLLMALIEHYYNHIRTHTRHVAYCAHHMLVYASMRWRDHITYPTITDTDIELS